MSALGLALLACAALLVPLSGLPAYVVLLGMAVAGAIAGVASDTVPTMLLTALPMRLVNLLENDLLQALPLYVFVGALLNRLPIADALFRCAIAGLRGGPAAPGVAVVGLGALLGPMNGSVGASVVALSRTVAPQLSRLGVPMASRHALIAVASTLGIVVPPSLVLILLGDAMMAAHTIALHATGRADRIINTRDVLAGAIAPALLFLALAIGVASLRAPGRARTLAAAAVRMRDVATALAALLFVGGLLVGVALGYFHPVEGAAAGAIVLFVAGVATGTLPLRALREVLVQALATTGALFALLVAATSFTLVFRSLGTDRLLEAWIAAAPGGPTLVTLAVLLALGLAALALDAFEIIFVLVPILMPPLLTRVPDATWVAVLVLLTLQASFLLPPIGYALLMTRGVLGERVGTRAVAAALAPYLVAQALVVVATLAWPPLAHLGQRESTAVPSVAPPVSDEEARRRMQEMLAPTDDADPPAPR